jgi:deazaflavin-dependent oxidoreductase (nitroreductase family)
VREHSFVTNLEPRARSTKYRALRVLLWVGNHLLAWALRHGLGPNAFALLETTGRRSGKPRQTPVGNGLRTSPPGHGDTFWLIAAHGPQADFVRNIIREPTVRVKVKGRWRSGTAALMPGDDTQERSRSLPYKWDAAIGRAIASSPMTIRIDLDPDVSHVG